ncbi:hypothetical protein NGUA15_02866 [Salmonella enterica]|nr:hypothetical protein NGUA15_02866 [Salmonella enterica]
MLRFVHGQTAATAIFRGVAGYIGLRHDLCELAVMFIYHCDPGAGADPMQASFPHKVIFINGVDKPRHDKTRAVTITIRQQQAKLIATQTGQEIAGAKHTEHQ